MQKNTGQGIPQHTETNSFWYILISPGLLTVPPSRKQSRQPWLWNVPCPHPRLSPRQYSWVSELSMAIQGAAPLGMGLVLLQCLSRSPCKAHIAWEKPLGALRWLSHQGPGARALHGDPAAVWACQSLGWGQWDKAGRVWGVWDGKEMFLIPQGQSSHCEKAPSQTAQGSLEILQSRIPHGRTHHLLETGPAPFPLHPFWGLAVPCRARRCKAFAGLTQSIITTKTENPGPRASPADFSLPVPFQCSTGG